jgi:hypothetical protein
LADGKGEWEEIVEPARIEKKKMVSGDWKLGERKKLLDDGGPWLGVKEVDLGFLSFFSFFFTLKITPCKFSTPFLCVVTSIYKQSGLVPKIHWSLNFFYFLSILIFSYFFLYF